MCFSCFPVESCSFPLVYIIAAHCSEVVLGGPGVVLGGFWNSCRCLLVVLGLPGVVLGGFGMVRSAYWFYAI